MAQTQAVIAHWAKLFEGLQASPLDFYKSVEIAVEKRKIPNLETSRVDWKESGVFSVKREYLRMQRGPHAFDICGAPFGNGFFVSSWFARMDPPPVLLIFLIVFVCAILLAVLFYNMFGFIAGVPLFIIGLPFAFRLFVVVMTDVREGWDDGLVAIPYIGPIYEFIFRPATYYKIDTAQMFQQAVHSAVMEAVDEMTAAKGVRSLSELERMPAMGVAIGRS